MEKTGAAELNVGQDEEDLLVRPNTKSDINSSESECVRRNPDRQLKRHILVSGARVKRISLIFLNHLW